MKSSGFDVPNVLGSMERELWRLLDELDSLLIDTRPRTGVCCEPHDSSPGHHRRSPRHSRPGGARPVRPLAVNAAANPMLTFLSLMFGTLVSEDLACVTAGLLIQRGQIEAS